MQDYSGHQRRVTQHKIRLGRDADAAVRRWAPFRIACGRAAATERTRSGRHLGRLREERSPAQVICSSTL